MLTRQRPLPGASATARPPGPTSPRPTSSWTFHCRFNLKWGRTGARRAMPMARVTADFQGHWRISEQPVLGRWCCGPRSTASSLRRASSCCA
eukprot:9146378-Pyramimonas_sp.AAC.1